jgi:hypothetical protein
MTPICCVAVLPVLLSLLSAPSVDLSVSGASLLDAEGKPVVLRGICFDSWLTQRVPHGSGAVRSVADLGANCVKLVVPFETLEAAGGGLREDGAAVVERMIGYARAAGCRVVLSCASPGSAKRFATNREVRVRFVDTWKAILARWARPDELGTPALSAIIPLEDPAEVLKDAAVYTDLCSYLAQEVDSVAREVPVFLAPLGNGAPSDPPLVSLPNVGAVWRLPAEATAEARVALVKSATTWSTTNARPVLIDRLAAKRGTPTGDRDPLLKAALAAILGTAAPISFVYDSFRCSAEGGDGVALSYPASGHMAMDEALATLLKSAFTGSLVPPQTVDTGKVEPPATPPR